MQVSAEALRSSRRGRPVNRAPEVVKSAVRVLEVLELFDTTRAPACVGSVAAALGFPQSSTSALLRSLVKVGYLRYDARARTYLPTERVPLLGNWIGRPLFQGGAVLDLVERLAARADCIVLLARRTGCNAQYVHLAGERAAIPAGMKIGTMLPLPLCAVGQVMLSTIEEAGLRKFLHRLNSEALPGDAVRVADFMAKVAAVRSAGYAVATDSLCTVLAARLPVDVAEDSLVIGLSTSVDRLADGIQPLLAMLREEVRGCLRPARRTLPGFDVPAPFALPVSRRAVQHATN